MQTCRPAFNISRPVARATLDPTRQIGWFIPEAPPVQQSSVIMPGYYWVSSSRSYNLPPHAVQGGMDSDGSTIYVGRAYHDGDWVPAKVIPERKEAYIAYGGREISLNEYEILCEQRFEWVCCSGGNIPHNAVEGGRTSDGETLYIGRVYHEGSQTIGKVHPSHSCLYIPYGGDELNYSDYEILVML